MKILYISDSYTQRGNSAAIRNNALVKGFIDLGHSVDVLTVKYPDRDISPYLQNGNIQYSELWNWTVRDKMAVVAKKNKIIGFLKGCYRALRKVVLFPDLCYKWPSIIVAEDYSDYDVMISSSDNKTSHFVGKKIKKANPSLKWLQIWGDPWFEDVNIKGIDKLRIPYYERQLLSLADKIVYISLPTADYMRNKYQRFASKIFFVPRSYYTSYVYDVPQDNERHIVYTGSIHAAYGRNMNDLINSVEKFNQKGGTKWVIDFYGFIDEQVKASISSVYVQFHKGVDMDALETIYKDSNILLFISNKSSSTQIPGKLYDYLGTSSLVLCLVNNKTDSIAGFLRGIGSKCYLVENNEDAISSALIELETLSLMQCPPCLDYSPQKIAKEIIDVIEK